ncbi:hypothetical protein IGI04_019271 [Brassica rapa subsp. trilocularis]|uniref:Uncharacterized protein n=1 Tax=Brassica rapa subsp. trilocularis TaxID=1813537 RepID=A0ABQ7MFD1_BRACM|nr:hypothetical protein IGI04_019271 [Brassica rapa subsp. trilocularis]
MAVPTPSLYKYRALDPDLHTEFLRGTSAKIVRDKPQKEKREPTIQRENRREAWLFVPGETGSWEARPEERDTRKGEGQGEGDGAWGENA